MKDSEKVRKEKAFDNFIDQDLYENASSAIWALVKAAYYDAWEKAQAFLSEHTHTTSGDD